eukprot:COSAG05_NODE_8_length_40675_cov_148.837539_13_plen_57_part_00
MHGFSITDSMETDRKDHHHHQQQQQQQQRGAACAALLAGQALPIAKVSRLPSERLI